MAGEGGRDNSFKLPGSSLDEVFKVVQGYASIGKGAPLSEISKNTGMHTTAISKNVGFLLSLGLLEGGKNKAPTGLGTKLGMALMHNMAEEVQTTLSEIVDTNEFLKGVLAAVRIRKGMDLSALRSHIAYSAGQSKTGSTATGAGAVIELLRRSGHLSEQDGKFAVSTPSSRPMDEPVVDERLVAAASRLDLLPIQHGNAPLSISIKIQVSCGPDDLDGLGEKLRKITEELGRESAQGLGEE